LARGGAISAFLAILESLYSTLKLGSLSDSYVFRDLVRKRRESALANQFGDFLTGLSTVHDAAEGGMSQRISARTSI
jgi:hypothetical protein